MVQLQGIVNQRSLNDEKQTNMDGLTNGESIGLLRREPSLNSGEKAELLSKESPLRNGETIGLLQSESCLKNGDSNSLKNEASRNNCDKRETSLSNGDNELLRKKITLNNGDIDANEATIEDDKIITLSVSGRRFQTLESTLARFPTSLLGNEESRSKLKCNEDGEIFLDRNQRAFEILLTFYQTGIFEEPTGLNLNVFKHEIRYFGLVEEAIECGIKGLDVGPQIFHKRKWQARLWNALEEPQSSVLARVITILSLTIIVLSVVVFCLETIPSINKSHTSKVLDYLEMFCIAYFSLEFLLRLLAAPNKLRFFYDFLNIIDLLAIIPFYITLGTNLQGGVSIYFLRTLRLIRVFRIFKLSRYSGEMKILGKALTDSARELGILVFFIVLGVILFSSAVYYADASDTHSQFKSIPGAFWWSIVTMTTVGYGDEVPKTVGEFSFSPFLFHSIR